MNIITDILLGAIAYLIQVLICSFIHIKIGTEIPKTLVDFLKLTFLPYVIINYKKIKEINTKNKMSYYIVY